MLRVALCDGDRPFRSLLRATLSRRSGFEVTGDCGDGVACLEDLARTTPDLLVLGLKMPLASGEDVLARISGVSPATRVVVVSGAPKDHAEPLVRGLGAADFLSKADRRLLDVLPERLERAAAAA